MGEANNCPDFSQPWKLSDIILKVEDVEFHVHKAMLALSSSVFSTMFQSNFKEKEQHCIPLPGKSAKEFRKLLEVIYPNFQRKITLKSCTFLLEYAREYMMERLTEKCKTFLEEKFNKSTKAQENHASVVVKILILAQEYGFSQLETECINELVTVKFSNLRKVRPGYENISMDNRLLILERRASNLEEDLEQTKEDLEQSETREEDAVSRLKLVTSRANKCFVEFIKFVNLCGAQLSRSAFACNRDPTDPSLFARSLEDIRRYDHTRYGDVRIDVEPLERLHVLLQKMI